MRKPSKQNKGCGQAKDEMMMIRDPDLFDNFFSCNRALLGVSSRAKVVSLV